MVALRSDSSGKKGIKVNINGSYENIDYEFKESLYVNH
jgi:hypothetical protein